MCSQTHPLSTMSRFSRQTALQRKLLRSRRLRVDTTVMEADVRYPTDSGLCAHAVSRLGRAVRAVKAAGLALRTRFRDRRRSGGKLKFKISHSGTATARLAIDVERTERVIRQTAQGLAGDRTIPDRVISLCDVDARPIRRGKPQQPTEFGYKVSLADTPEGFVVSHEVYAGNPADAQAAGRRCPMGPQ